MEKLRKYNKHEFCKDMNCNALYNNKCIYRPDTDKCIFTAKQFHTWLKENNFEIRKVKPFKYRCVNCHKKFRTMQPHECGGIMRVTNLTFRAINGHKLHTLAAKQIGI